MAEPERPAPPKQPLLVSGNTDFAFDLYRHLCTTEGNLFFSPYSVSAALAMTSTGARGDTLAEMNRTLHFPPQDKLHPAFADLAPAFKGTPGSNRGYELRTANRLWGQTDYGFLPQVRRTLQDNYGAGIEEVDFGDPEQVCRTINSWTAKETRHKIKDLLLPGIVTPRARFVLTNAIYFKGDWVSRFKRVDTQVGPFHLGDGKTVRTQLMRQSGGFLYASGGETFDAVELPYAGQDVTMVVLLPKKVDGLAQLEKELTAEQLSDVLERLSGTQVHLTLPKFKLIWSSELTNTLSTMGLRKVFVPGEADLSGFTGKPDLFLQAVVHQACVEVNEEGTTAAATAASGSEESEESVTFQADHPFLFLIRDRRSGSILFLGRLNDPTR
jgi:serpin B